VGPSGESSQSETCVVHVREEDRFRPIAELLWGVDPVGFGGEGRPQSWAKSREGGAHADGQAPGRVCELEAAGAARAVQWAGRRAATRTVRSRVEDLNDFGPIHGCAAAASCDSHCDALAWNGALDSDFAPVNRGATTASLVPGASQERVGGGFCGSGCLKIGRHGVLDGVLGGPYRTAAQRLVRRSEGSEYEPREG
jgi:hypothetical protein